jgi:hypothetical protein
MCKLREGEMHERDLRSLIYHAAFYNLMSTAYHNRIASMGQLTEEGMHGILDNFMYTPLIRNLKGHGFSRS